MQQIYDWKIYLFSNQPNNVDHAGTSSNSPLQNLVQIVQTQYYKKLVLFVPYKGLGKSAYDDQHHQLRCCSTTAILYRLQWSTFEVIFSKNWRYLN